MDFEAVRHAPRGYVSEESKRTFSVAAGVLGAVFFLAQIVIPFVAMMTFMPVGMASGMLDLRMADVEGAVAWRGDLWYVSTGVGNHREASSSTLMRWPAGGEDKPQRVGGISFEGAVLLAAPDRLWVIGHRFTTWVQEGVLAPPVETERLGAFSRPFLHRGRPTVLVKSPDGTVLSALEDGRWVAGTKIAIGAETERSSASRDVQAAARGERLDLFERVDRTIYRRAGDAWMPVAEASRHWAVRALGDDLVLVHDGGAGDFGARLTVLNFAESGARPIVEHRLPLTTGFGIAGESAGRFWILAQGFPGSLRSIEFRDGRPVSERKLGGAFPFGGGFMGMMLIPQAAGLAAPILLALILSTLMSRHRVCEFGEAGRRVPFASLARRAWAQVIDAVIEWGPAAAGGAVMVSRIDDFFDPLQMLAAMGLVFAGMAWMVLLFFVFSFTEGRWGWTPGKWLCGIRVVGVDLEPCGFGRALLRNLLKFADGFFNFLVGILVSALSENWQRVGDMAARTIVIRVYGGRNPVAGQDPGVSG